MSFRAFFRFTYKLKNLLLNVNIHPKMDNFIAVGYILGKEIGEMNAIYHPDLRVDLTKTSF